MANSAFKILLLGPRLNRAETNVGGATRSFEQLVRYLTENQVEHRVINTQRGNAVANWLGTIAVTLVHIWSYPVVMLNTSQNGIRFLAPVIFWLGRLAGKKVVIRPFGGAFIAQYEQAGGFQKWLFQRTVFRADILCLQTQLLIDYFAPLAGNVQQLTTSRFLPEVAPPTRTTFRKRFVFVSHIKESKGVELVLEAARQLDDSFTVHLYGPVMESRYESLSSTAPELYKGVLQGEEAVHKTLSDYDVLIFPSHYEGEGHPGIILEAYSLGLPVIATDWKALPELVKRGKTGSLIPPHSASALVAAMQQFDTETYATQSAEALAYFRSTFAVNAVLDPVLSDLQNLHEPTPPQ